MNNQDNNKIENEELKTIVNEKETAILLAQNKVEIARLEKEKEKHQEELKKIELNIDAVQRSTRTLFPKFLKLHNYCRLKWKWYYKWHLNPYAKKIHWAILILYIMLVTAALVYVFLIPNRQTVKAVNTCASTGSGDWQTAGTWTSCGSTIPQSGDSASIGAGHVVTLSGAVDIGAGATTVAGTITTNNYAMTMGSMTISTGGTVTAGSSTFTCSGSWNHSAGTFTYGTSTIIMTGTGTFNTGGNSKPINKLQVTGAGQTITLSARTAFVTGGILTIGSASGARATIDGSQTIDLVSGSTPPIAFVGTYDASSGGGYKIDSTSINYLMSGNHNIPGGNYGTLAIRGNASSNLTATMTGALTTSASLNIYHNSNTYKMTLDTSGNNYALTTNGISIGVSGVTTRYGALKCNDSTLNFGISDVTIYASDANGDNKIIADSADITSRRVYTNNDANGFEAGTSSMHFLQTYTTTTRIITTGGTAFYDVEFDNFADPASYKYTISGNLIVNHNLTLTDGQLDLGTNNPTVSVGGNFFISNTGTDVGVWTKSSSGITFNGTTDFTDNTTSKQDLGNTILNGTSLSIVAGGMKTSNFTLTAGTFDVNDLSMNITGSTVFTTGTYKTGTSSNTFGDAAGDSVTINGGTLEIESDATADITKNAGTWTNTAGTIVYKAGSAVNIGTVTGLTPYYNLGINSSGSTYSIPEATEVDNNFTITAGTLYDEVLDFTVTGTFSNEGTLQLLLDGGQTIDLTNDDNSGTVEYLYGDFGPSIIDWTYFNLTINGSGGYYEMPAVASTTVNGNLNITDGTLDLSNSGSTVDIVVVGNITLDTNGTLVANDATITVSGNWSNAGTFTAGASTVTFNSTNPSTLYGNTTFYSLNMNTTTDGAKNIYFEGGTTQTIGGTWTIDGASGKVLVLQSTEYSSQWYFNITSGFTSGDYISVQDSYSVNTNKITAGTNCNNLGNNDGWIFNSAPVNDSLTFTNPYTTNVAVSDDTTEWQFQAKVTDVNGPTNINYIMLRMANNSDSTTPYDSIRLKWTESTDTFSEDADTQNAITLTSTGADSSSSGNQWTLNFKIKINNNFLNKDTNYAAELYSIDDSSASDLDNYANIYQVATLSLSFDVDSATIAFGNLLPGSVLTGTTTATVTTNYPVGYSMGISDGISSTGSALLHTDSTTRIIDYAGTIATPTSWSGSGLGICPYDSTDKDTSKWGTGTTEADSNNKYAGVPETNTTIFTVLESSIVDDVAKIGYKVVVPNTQKTGDYSGPVTITATGTLP